MRELEQYFKALADTTRLRILNLLLQGELCVCDIQCVLGISQPAASRHLAYLKNSGMVLDNRDGYRIFYRLAQGSNGGTQPFLYDFLRDAFREQAQLKSDTKRLKEAISAGACAVCDWKTGSAIDSDEASGATKTKRRTSMQEHYKVLILCTGNSARSQMAEGLLRNMGGEKFEVASAGTRPVGMNPDAVKAMSEIGIDISGGRSKHVDEFVGQQLDYIITVCDNAKESCPIFPGGGKRVHHSFRDPAAAPAQEQPALFREVRDEIQEWLSEFIAEIAPEVQTTGAGEKR